MKRTLLILVTSLNLLAIASSLRAQTLVASPVLAAAAETESLTPVTAIDVPLGATVWLVTATSQGGVQMVPLPGLTAAARAGQIPIYQIAGAEGQYILDGIQAPVDAAQAAAGVLSLIDRVRTAAQTVASATATSSLMGRSSLQALGAPGVGLTGAGGGTLKGAANTLVIDTNQLYLTVTGLTNGVGYFQLHQTNKSVAEVFAIWSSTNLAAGSAGWTVEQELWPGGTNPITFTVPLAGRNPLFLRAENWTGVMVNGLPAWWLFYWFGDLTGTADTLDAAGNTLLYDYQNGIDPVPLQFTVATPRLDVNQTTVPVTINLTAGHPAKYAVLVNNTNLAAAFWQSFAGTNLQVTLGATDGVYNVAVGLKGAATNAAAVWDTDSVTFWLNRVAPKLYLTNPVLASAAATVAKPWLQLQGFADAPLAALTCTVSNAAGVSPDTVGVTGVAGYDAVLGRYRTNYFQAYDVPLALAANRVTLTATDPAGNTVTTNFTVTLDYHIATKPPELKLIWPQNGAGLAGDTFTIRGTLSDETGQVTAQVTGTNGAQTYPGIVERNHQVWVPDVPLKGVTAVTLRATDAAGNVTVTNFTVQPGGLALSVEATPEGEALYDGGGTVSGWVGAADATVTVNGVAAVVEPGPVPCHWTAANVPIIGQGMAVFDVTASPAGGVQPKVGGSNPDTATHQSAVVAMPSAIRITTYSFGEGLKQTQAGRLVNERATSVYYTAAYAPGADGQWEATYQAGGEWYWSNPYPLTNTSVWASPEPFNVNGIVGQAFVSGDSGSTMGPNASYVPHHQGRGVWHQWDYPDGRHQEVNLAAVTRWTLYAGGYGVAGEKLLFAVTASALAVGQSSVANNNWANPWSYVPLTDVLPGGVLALGKAGDANGVRWQWLAAGSAVDLGVDVPGVKHASLTVDQSRYHLVHEVLCVAPGDTNLNRTTLGLRESVTLFGMSDGTEWTLSGPGYLSGMNGSAYYMASSTPGVATVTAKPKDAEPTSVTFNVIQPSGVSATVYTNIPLGKYDPKGTNMGAHTDFRVYIMPTNVSFGGLNISEVKSPLIVTWPNGSVMNLNYSFNTNVFIIGCTDSSFKDQVAEDMRSTSLLFNGTTYTNFSFKMTWAYAYRNDQGVWVPFASLQSETKYGADGTCQEIYNGVPGSVQGPYGKQ